MFPRASINVLRSAARVAPKQTRAIHIENVVGNVRPSLPPSALLTVPGAVTEHAIRLLQRPLPRDQDDSPLRRVRPSSLLSPGSAKRREPTVDSASRSWRPRTRCESSLFLPASGEI